MVEDSVERGGRKYTRMGSPSIEEDVLRVSLLSRAFSFIAAAFFYIGSFYNESYKPLSEHFWLKGESGKEIVVNYMLPDETAWEADF